MDTMLVRHPAVIAIGTDCPGLQPSHLLGLVDGLGRHPVAIGPSTDGGYWAIGVTERALLPTLFADDLPWSRDSLVADTARRLESLDRSWHRGPDLLDIDLPADLRSACDSGLLPGQQPAIAHVYTGMQVAVNTGNASHTAEASRPTMSNDVARLLEAHLAGDHAAFDEVVRDHQSAALGFAFRLIGDHSAAADIVQEAFVRVLRHADRYDGRRSFRTWLFHIVRNLAIDHMRREGRKRHQILFEHHRQGEDENSIQRGEISRQVWEIIDSLPNPYRELLIMREIEELAADHIAAVTDCDYGTTRWRLHKARQLFRDSWMKRFGQEDC